MVGKGGCGSGIIGGLRFVFGGRLGWACLFFYVFRFVFFVLVFRF